MPLTYRPSYIAAAVSAGAVLVLYLITLAPTTAMWDAGEYIAAAYSMGVAHPPGNPLFILLGRTFAVMPIAPTAAQRINVLAALCSALSAGLWFLVAERVVSSWLRERWQRIVVASIAALTGAAAFTVWNHSVVNEKVYTITLLGLAVVSWIAMRWTDEPDERRQGRLLVLAAYLLVLGYTNHMGGLLAAPALGALVLALRPSTLLRWPLLLGCAGAMAVGVTPYATQVIRASHMPAINMGVTSACEGEVSISCLTSTATIQRLGSHLGREQYLKPPLLDRQAPLTRQVGMYWLYFRWQWVRDLAGQMPVAQTMTALLFLGLGLYGGWLHWRRDRRTFWYFGTFTATLSLGLVFYMNFRLGWTQAMLAGNDVLSRDVAEVRDRDYFFLWSFSAWSVWLAVGLAGVWKMIAEALERVRWRANGSGPRIAWIAAAPVLLVAILPLVSNWGAASRRGETFTRDWAHDVLNSIEPYGILITFGDNDTYPLWYAQEVEGMRRDVTQAVATLLGTDWYAPNLLHQPAHPYDSAAGPGIFAGLARPHPGPALHMSPAEARDMQPFVMLQQPARFEHAGLSATIPAGMLTRDQIFVLTFIRDSFPHRPIYFTAPGDYLERLGLDQYLVREGLVYRLTSPGDLDRDSVVEVPGLEQVNVDRTLVLWDTVYRGQEALIRQRRWVDAPSVSIPYAYIRAGAVLAAALEAGTRTADAERVLDTAAQMAVSAGLGQLLR